MKLILVLCAILVVAGGAYVVSMKGPAVPHFGPAFEKSAVTPVKDVVARPEAFASETIQVSGVITRQCPSSGCWFFVKDDQGNQLKVELGHMGMKFPQSVGKTAVVEGRVLNSPKQIELVGNNVEFR